MHVARAPMFCCSLLAFAALAGCGNAGPLADVDVQSASLTALDWTDVDIVVGFAGSPAQLNVVDTAGKTHSIEVGISGPSLGILMDVGAGDSNKNDCLVQNSASLVLPPGKQLKGSDLVGGYFGSEEAAHLALGGVSHDLTNGAGVHLTGGAINVGFGFMVAMEWLSIDAK